MPIWQEVEDAFERLKAVRVSLDDALRVVIEGRNAGGVPVLEILVAEVENLTRAVMEALGAGPGKGPHPTGATQALPPTP